MKKLLSILICLLLSVSSMFAASTITIEAYAVNKDGSTPVGGTVTLKVTKSEINKNATQTTNSYGTGDGGNPISVVATGKDATKLFGIIPVPGYNPIVTFSVSPKTSEGYYVESISIERENGQLEGQTIAESFEIEGMKTETLKYKVVFAKRNASVPDEITSTNLTSLFYTGMEDNQSASAFYKQKTKVDLTNTFADGQPLFDWLYIFGVTKNVNGSIVNNPTTSVACNATTPCYVYKKSDNKYVFDSEVDAVGTRYNHGTSMNGKKLYFTGYCPFANIGMQSTDEGWMYFQGEQNHTVDIYLENCEILGRYRTSDGTANSAKYATNIVDLALGNNYMRGFSSIFVFEAAANASSVSRAYKPTIHISGTNHLKGQLGFITEVLGLGQTVDNYGKPRLRNITTASSPITIKGSGGYVSLTLDDVWPQNGTSKLTNGFLKLDTYTISQEGNKAEKVPSIDLGSKFASLTINGGQYLLRNSASVDGEYTCNMAFSYRAYSLAGIVTLYGFGGDMTDVPVVINSGTFTMYKNMFGTACAQYFIDQEEFMDLRLPYGDGKSQINGGTFNGISNVVMCSDVTSSGMSPINAQGEWLCLQNLLANDDLTDNNPATFTLPDHIIDWGITSVAYDLTATGAKEALALNEVYGGQSVNAFKDEDDNTYVRLLLPGAACDSEDCVKIIEAQYRNWVTALPDIKATYAGGLGADFGGDVEVPMKSTGESSLDVKVQQLMYVDMQGMEQYEFATTDVSIVFNNKQKPWGSITNLSKYSIEDHLNIVKVVEADRWYCFTAPFDIHQVFVVELNENEISSQSSRDAALQKQIESNTQLWVKIQTLIIPAENGRSSAKTFDYMVDKSAGGKLEPITHYDGNNLMTANYYLYELDSLDTNGNFKTSDTGTALNIDWKPVNPDAGKPLMSRDKTYAIQFPYCPMCNDLDSRDYYDYWTLKYVRFYGKGPQDVQGSNYQSTILATAPDPGYATLVGNSTLADMTLAAEAGYVHNTTNDFFEKNNSEVKIKPTQGYMLYGGGAKGMPERISRSGKMIFGDNTTTDLEGVPTIGDRTSIMLFDAMDGFEVLSLCEQLVMVYNLQGNLIFRQQMAEGEQVHIAAAEGIYVVKGEKEAIKIMVD